MSETWNTYRTRFLVHAKQLTEPLSFTDPLGRDHHGSAGDYLVQSSEGLLRIAPREIFEDIYVVMEDSRVELQSQSSQLDCEGAERPLSARLEGGSRMGVLARAHEEQLITEAI